MSNTPENTSSNNNQIPQYPIISRRNFMLGATALGVASILGDRNNGDTNTAVPNRHEDVDEGFMRQVANDIGQVFEQQIENFLSFHNLTDVITGTLKVQFINIVLNVMISKIFNINLGGAYAEDKTELINKMVDRDAIGLFFQMSFYAPILEEIIFRYLPYKYFARKDGKISWDVGIVSTVLFGYIHNFTEKKQEDGTVKESFNMKNQPLPQIILGLLCYYLIEKKGIEASIVAHMTANMTGFSMIYVGNKLGKTPEEKNKHL